MSDVPDLILDRSEGRLTMTINRPDRLNAVTTGTLRRLERAIVEAGDDPEVRVVVLAGAGRAFCSGADLDAADAGEEPVSAATVDAANAVVTAVRRLPQPVVAAVHGPAAGVGVSLALAADLVVAAESTYFLLAFTKVGLMPDGGATALVAAAIGRARAMRMALLAERLGAAEAHAAGLISHVAPPEEVPRVVECLARELAAGPPRAYALTKAAVNDATLGELDGALARERHGQASLLRSADYAEGAAAFLARRPPRFHGR